MDDDCDVIVVGAGLSGLTAARHLQRDGRSVLVLEASSRVGGRTLSVERDGSTWELGGQWVARTQPHILELLEEFDISTYAQHIQGNKVLLTADGARTVFSDQGFGHLPLSMLECADTLRGLVQIDLASRNLSVRNAALTGAQYDRDTLASLARTWVSYPRVLDMIALVTRVCLGTEPSLVSALFFLAYCRGVGGVMPLCEIKNGGQEFRIVGGSHQISLRMASELGSHRLMLDSPVVSVSQASPTLSR